MNSSANYRQMEVNVMHLRACYMQVECKWYARWKLMGACGSGGSGYWQVLAKALVEANGLIKGIVDALANIVDRHPTIIILSG